MSVSKLKNLLLAALLLINALFIIIIIIDSSEDARIERQAIDLVCALLEDAGITIDPERIRPSGELRAMRTSRVHEAVAQIALAALGPADMVDHGVILTYDSPENGVAEFSGGGDFEIRLNDGVITNTRGARQAAQRLLQDMDIEVSQLLLSGNPESEVITAVVSYKGVSIFNTTVEFAFYGQNLKTIAGRFVTGIEAEYAGASISTAATALLAFLADVRKGEIECNSIESVEAGYHFRAAGSFGEGVIAPVWLITADSGRYIIDDMTGDIWHMQ